MNSPSPLLGYALNAFPYEDLRGMFNVLRRDAATVQRTAFPGKRFPIELRFSQKIVDSLRANPRALTQLRALLRDGGFQLVTINGFVPLSFHKGRVKERVYLPRWDAAQRGPRSRVAFTNECVSLLAGTMDKSIPFGSVSVPAGILKRDVKKSERKQTLQAIARAMSECARHAAEIHLNTGRHIMIGLEPAGLTCETTDETIEFFECYLWPVLPPGWRDYIGVNFDLCHQLVEWEKPFACLRQLRRRNILITKIHVTNAIQLDNPLSSASTGQRERLLQFYADSKFLHQTIGIDRKGRPITAFLDLPEVFSQKGVRELKRRNIKCLRIHYHMPLFESPDSRIHTTLPEVKQFLRQWKTEVSRLPGLGRIPLIIETYTWQEQLRADVKTTHANLGNCIVEEIRAVRSYLR